MVKKFYSLNTKSPQQTVLFEVTSRNSLLVRCACTAYPLGKQDGRQRYLVDLTSDGDLRLEDKYGKRRVAIVSLSPVQGRPTIVYPQDRPIKTPKDVEYSMALQSYDFPTDLHIKRLSDFKFEEIRHARGLRAAARFSSAARRNNSCLM